MVVRTARVAVQSSQSDALTAVAAPQRSDLEIIISDIEYDTIMPSAMQSSIGVCIVSDRAYSLCCCCFLPRLALRL